MTRWPLPDPMKRALELAQIAAELGEVPIGAVVVRGQEIIGEGHNLTRTGNDPTAHAEIVAIRRAAQAMGQDRLEGCAMFVTLEPCPMCAGAIAHARLAALTYGASDPKGGGVEHGARVFEQAQCHHRPQVYAGIGEGEAAEVLRGFFAGRR